MSYKGKYKPSYPQKYKGDPTNIIYRSLWERKFMVYCDNNERILEWGSEEIALPYRSPVDNRVHRYFPDFYIKVKESKHTLRFTADVYNFTNFISKELGTQQVPITTTPLNFVKLDTDGKTPIFSFPYLDGRNKVPFTDSFRDNVGFGSRFQIQLGVRYLFN